MRSANVKVFTIFDTLISDIRDFHILIYFHERQDNEVKLAYYYLKQWIIALYPVLLFFWSLRFQIFLKHETSKIYVNVQKEVSEKGFEDPNFSL